MIERKLSRDPAKQLDLATGAKEPDLGPDGHRFNDDLLLDDEHRRAEYEQRPAMTRILDFPELREVFAPIDKEANRAKKASQGWGFWAVIMALLSLFGGSSEAVWGRFDENWVVFIAGLCGLLGIVAVLLAMFGVLLGTRKRTWLGNRLRTERLRQMHFQVFPTHFERIVALISDARDGKIDVAAFAAYDFERKKILKEFVDRLGEAGSEGKRPWRKHIDEELEAIIASDAERPPPVWLHGDRNEPLFPEGSYDTGALDAVFKAYADFRIGEQISFATYTLRNKNDRAASSFTRLRRKPHTWFQPWPWFPARNAPLRRWRGYLTFAWRCAITALICLHAYIVVCALFKPEWVHPAGLRIDIAVIWAALVAVAAKTLGEGLAVNREVQRYEEYLAVCSELGREFCAEETSTERKFELMVRMERTSFEEMREFLRSSEEATFVL